MGMRGKASLAVALSVAAVLTVLPLCVAEGQTALPDTQLVQETVAESSFSEDGFEEATDASPMALVEEATEEAMSAVADLEDGEVQAGIENAIRSAVRRLVASSTQQAMLQQPGTPQVAAKQALAGVRAQIDQQFVEQAAKKEAVKVAKQHARAAAARAAARGASAVEQARVARSTASHVAQSFARVARNSGVKLALDELSLQGSQPIELTATEMDSAATAQKEDPAKVSHQISKAASVGVTEAKANAKQVAKQEAAKAGLSKSQTKKLESEAAAAVRQAAGDLNAGTTVPGSDAAATNIGALSAAAKNAAADTDAALSGQHGRISIQKAQEAGKEKAKKSELAKYEAEAAEEKRKTRLALREAANQEKKAAKFVDSVATNSLARGLDKQLSTKNLKLAAAKATTASQQVEQAVKDSVNKALRQKDRLNRANEKVEKAGAAAAKEAQEKNAEARQQQFDIKNKQEQKAKLDAKELVIKKQHANEAAHKAITRVVTAAGEKASRTVARAKASAIQKDFLIAACHRHAQHSMRLVGETEKNRLADRGLSATAQRDGELKVLKKKEKSVVDETVSNAVRRQAHLSAMNAKKHAAARGLSNAAQLTAARKAWKKAEPEIKGYCAPAAKRAASAEVKTPGQAPEAIDQHQFVVKAVKTMQTAVSKACDDATKPLVIDGAKLAARHNADYKWQVDKGYIEAAKVCNATLALYTQNAEVKSKEMVQRSFDESAEAKQKSLLFQQRIREDAEGKVLRAQDEAAQKTKEHMSKQCEKKTDLATTHAKNKAARTAVGELAKDQAKSAAKAAQDKAYQEALADGLSETHARKAGKEAYDKTYSATHANVKAATGGVAPKAPTTTAELAELHTEWQQYTELAQRKRAKEVKAKRTAKETPSRQAHRAAELSLVEASDAEHDASTVHSELQHVQLQVAAREIQVPVELFSDDEDVLVSTSTEHREARRSALVHAIATAVKSLHQLGGHLPSEVHIAKLQAQLQHANSRIAELEGKADNVAIVDDAEQAEHVKK